MIVFFVVREFIQKSSVPTVGQKEIGLDCPWIKAGGRACRGKLHDNILDWEHNLPERDLEMADMHSRFVFCVIYTNEMSGE